MRPLPGAGFSYRERRRDRAEPEPPRPRGENGGAFETAVHVAASHPATAPVALTNLALGLQDRYLDSGDPDDLARAIDCCERAGQGGASVEVHVMLGDLLRLRYESTGDRFDLDHAVALLRDGLQATPSQSPERPRRLVDLGIAMSPPGNTDRPRRLFALALATRDRYALSGEPADLDNAVGAYRLGCGEGLTGDPPCTVTAAQEWGAWATARRSWPEAAAAYRAAIAAMLAVVQAQVIREYKENWLRDTAGLPGYAAYASAMAHQLPAAVAAAEAGRAAILTETLQRDHLDLRKLAGQRPDLADRFARAASRLQAVQQRPLLRPGR